MNQRRMQIASKMMVIYLLMVGSGFLHRLHLQQCHASCSHNCNDDKAQDSSPANNSSRHNTNECQICFNLVLVKALAADIPAPAITAPVDLYSAVFPNISILSACDISLSLFARPPPA
ncbi:MAG: hypothetical protein JW709_02310 [Sedimentisphaerales bacterium]|nr:hypothetical protein [Sedimentisphaerales bacterium]